MSKSMKWNVFSGTPEPWGFSMAPRSPRRTSSLKASLEPGEACRFHKRLSRSRSDEHMDSPGSSPGQAQVKSGMREKGTDESGVFQCPSPRGPCRRAEDFQEHFQATERSHRRVDRKRGVRCGWPQPKCLAQRRKGAERFSCFL